LKKPGAVGQRSNSADAPTRRRRALYATPPPSPPLSTSLQCIVSIMGMSTFCCWHARAFNKQGKKLEAKRRRRARTHVNAGSNEKA
jgi:hypothetical protein